MLNTIITVSVFSAVLVNGALTAFFPKFNVPPDAPLRYYWDNVDLVAEHVNNYVRIHDFLQRTQKGLCGFAWLVSGETGRSPCLPGSNTPEISLPSDDELLPLHPTFIKYISQTNFGFSPMFRHPEQHRKLIDEAVNLAYAWEQTLLSGLTTTKSTRASSSTTTSLKPLVTYSPAQISSMAQYLERILSKAAPQGTVTRQTRTSSLATSAIPARSSPGPDARSSYSSAKAMWATRYGNASILDGTELPTATSLSGPTSTSVIRIVTFTPLIEGDELYTFTAFELVAVPTGPTPTTPISSSSSNSSPRSNSSPTRVVTTSNAVVAGACGIIIGGILGLLAML